MPDPQATDHPMGQHGFEYINDTVEHSGDFIAIRFVEDSIFTTLTGKITGNDPTGDTFPAGLTMVGAFTVIDLQSGKCFAYHRDPQ